jgi:hypothetical protein
MTEPRVQVPSGHLAAAYGSWPFVAVGAIPVGQELSAGDVGRAGVFSVVIASLTAARTLLWLRHRKRHYVAISSTDVLIRDGREEQGIASGAVTAATWRYGK